MKNLGIFETPKQGACAWVPGDTHNICFLRGCEIATRGFPGYVNYLTHLVAKTLQDDGETTFAAPKTVN